MEKYHKQDVAPIEKENERDENYEASNPQIDSERTRNNYRFTPYFGKTYTEFINGRIKELGLSPRKDAVVMNSFVLGSDNELIPFKNVFNEWLARDTSKKIRAVIRNKGEAGKPLTNTPPLG